MVKMTFKGVATGARVNHWRAHTSPNKWQQSNVTTRDLNP